MPDSKNDARWLKVVDIEKIYIVIIETHENACSNTPRFRKLGHSAQIWNAALMHQEGLKG